MKPMDTDRTAAQLNSVAATDAAIAPNVGAPSEEAFTSAPETWAIRMGPPSWSAEARPVTTRLM